MKSGEKSGYGERMIKTTDAVNVDVKKYIDMACDEIGDEALRDILMQIPNRRSAVKPSLYPNLLRNALEASGEKNWEQHINLLTASELQTISYYYANWVYDDKFNNSHKQSMNASLITRPLAYRAISEWANSPQKVAMLPKVLEYFNNADYRVELGQRMDAENTYDNFKELPFEEQVKRAEKRTRFLAGEFNKTLCGVGGFVAGETNWNVKSQDRVRALEQFGTNFGLAMQYVNDIADFATDSGYTAMKNESDKFSDFKLKKMTMPLIYAFKNAGKGERRFLHDCLSQDKIVLTESDQKEVSGILTNTGAFADTKRLCKSHYRSAKSALHGAFDKEDRKWLGVMASASVSNKFLKDIKLDR